MIISAPFRDHNPRLAVLAVAMLAGFGLLLFALFRVQVLHADRYGSRETAQSLRRIRLPSARGEIVDRAGVVLANNRPSYDIAISLDQLGRISKRQDAVRIAEANIFSISRVLNLPVAVSDRDVRNHYERRRPIPMPLWKDLRTDIVAAFVERAGTLPGTDLIVTPVRQYPHGTLAAHALGFCGKAEQSPDDDEETFYYYQADTLGKQGVERAFDADLRGAPGGRTIRVNPAGMRVGNVGDKPAERGNRLVLTLDSRIQKIAERALTHAPLPAGKELRGAAVVLDPRNGEILALASLPAFDPNLFNPGTPAATINALLQGTAHPMLNRAIGAAYAPGSIFKPVTLLAGLEAGTVQMSDHADCTGGQQIGNRRFGCWNTRGHGRVDAFMAMMQSCDVWYYQEGMQMGVDWIARVATEFGLGRPTGLDYARDKAGLVPTPDWKRTTQGERWWDGDTAQLSIGQSFLLASPLQMANVAATLANGGQRYRPFIAQRIETPDGQVVHQTPTAVLNRLSAKPQNVALVRQTMLQAVESSQGTGHHAGVPGLRVAGKTGTAEFDLREDGRTRRINRAWFIGFAPYDNPAIAMAVLIEDGVSGGHTAAPVAGEIMAGIFKRPWTKTGGGAYAD
ncbi:MAG: Peptidoglycan D,D-transpeptidase MrdA [Verrucomicrobiae bacterium]|nr:Peptidoglycan D,D-transpeptidase MrdA [Verrucomicrobiae bacterium]